LARFRGPCPWSQAATSNPYHAPLIFATSTLHKGHLILPIHPIAFSSIIFSPLRILYSRLCKCAILVRLIDFPIVGSTAQTPSSMAGNPPLGSVLDSVSGTSSRTL
jgi:hypothetical protein